MPGGNGRNSKRQTSRTHHDSVSQSGQPQRSQTPRPQRGNGGGTRNPLGGNPLAMGYSPTSNPLDFSHGGSKKNRRKKGGGSR